tara:strand:- start:410 stop:1192 length:783 start_codon:yes stop_codon:yes gene_type:complete
MFVPELSNAPTGWDVLNYSQQARFYQEMRVGQDFVGCVTDMVRIPKNYYELGIMAAPLGTALKPLSTGLKALGRGTENALRKVPVFDIRQAGLQNACNQAPYCPYAMKEILQSRYPNEIITSTTLPARGMRGTAVDPLEIYQKTGVVYDPRRLPNFTDHMVYEMQIPVVKFFPEKGSTLTLDLLRASHMRQATRQLRADISAGTVSRGQFKLDQLKAIQSGEPHIPKLTWEHNPRAGRMQLVDMIQHKDTPHVGSIGLFK